ncbi:unnamed protein product [Schistosoma margrebowiei]|uniref:SWIM-type domain-containing protein n=1 Tax=Schistosoma margrebowiei TaxID=48269 RepID=A0A3P8H5D6_9TREM|nr:unnamed protein product [Schistosoma margrebowiei]
MLPNKHKWSTAFRPAAMLLGQSNTNFVEITHRILKLHKLNRRIPVLKSIFSVLLCTGYWIDARMQKYYCDCRNKTIIGREPVICRLQERLTPAACQLLKRHLRTPITKVVMSVDLSTAVDGTGTYTVCSNPLNCSCDFYIENRIPCRHILAYCIRSNNEVNTQIISDRWLQSDSYITSVAIDNTSPVQIRQASVRRSLYALVRCMSEEQCTIVYNNAYQVVYGRIPPAPSTLPAVTEFQIESSTSTNVTKPSIHQTAVTSNQHNVDMDETLSNEEEEIVSMNSEEFTELDDDNDENAHDNRLCDICNLAQPPHETADGSTWIFCRCDAMFHLFSAYDPSTHVHGIHCPMCGAITES